MIQTNNLQLLQWNTNHVQALLRGKDELAGLLQVSIPFGWPQFPEAFTLPADEMAESITPPNEWGGYFFIDTAKKALVGSGGFHGAPDESGSVEIGYEIATEYWNRGYATAAVKQLIDFAFVHPEVTAVTATTLGETNASNRVLQKLGMTFKDELTDPEHGKLWRYQITRDKYKQS